MEEIRQYYKFRPDELFRRITVTSLVTLMLEVSKLEYQEEDSEKLANQIREDQESLQKMNLKGNNFLVFILLFDPRLAFNLTTYRHGDE